MTLRDALELTRPYWAVFATAAGVTLLLTPMVRNVAVRTGLVSRPVEDRWGRRAIARLGGVAMYLGFLTAMLVCVPLEPPLPLLILGATLVFGLGLADDLRRMPPYTKLVGQLLICSLLVLGGLRIPMSPWNWLSIPASILWFVLAMNAFNLLDNMDGLAAGTGAIAATFCVAHAILTGQSIVAAVGAGIAGVSLGFLRYNFPPAKIFMGDGGSHLLGLSLAVLAVIGSWQHSTHLLSVLAVPTLVLAVPIFDTCFVTVQRLVNRQNPMTGGTDHVSHRLAVLGLSVQQTVVSLYGLSAAVGVLSLVSITLKPMAALALWLSVFTVLMLCGLYLAKVNVYRLATAAPEPGGGGRPATLIRTMLMHKRRLLEVLVDFCLITSVLVFAYLLRFEGTLGTDLQELIIKSLPIILAVKLASFNAHGLYRGVWRYLGLPDVIAIVKAVTVGSTLSALILLYVWRFEGFSRAVLVIDWMLTLLAIGGARVVERLLDEWITAASAQGVPVAIMGAGDAGARVARLLKEEEPARRRVVAFLDDDARLRGNLIQGIPVIGGRERLAALIDQEGVRELLIAMSDPPGELLRYVQERCETHGVTWRVVTAGVTHAI